MISRCNLDASSVLSAYANRTIRPLLLDRLKILLTLWDGSLSFAEIETFNVYESWDEVDEKESNHWAIYINDISDIHLEKSN